MRKLFKISQVSCFETKQTKKGFACFWPYRRSPWSRNYNCSPRGYVQIKASAWHRQVCPLGILGTVTRPCMVLPAGYRELWDIHSTKVLSNFSGPRFIYTLREQRGQSKGSGSTMVWDDLLENPTQGKNAVLVSAPASLSTRINQDQLTWGWTVVELQARLSPSLPLPFGKTGSCGLCEHTGKRVLLSLNGLTSKTTLHDTQMQVKFNYVCLGMFRNPCGHPPASLDTGTSCQTWSWAFSHRLRTWVWKYNFVGGNSLRNFTTVYDH